MGDFTIDTFFNCKSKKKTHFIRSAFNTKVENKIIRF